MTRVVRILHLRRLLDQRLRTLLAAVAVAAGVSLSVAVAVASSSVTTSIGRFGTSVAGAAPLRVTGPTRGGVDEAAVAELAGAAQGASVVPVVQTIALAEGDRGSAPVLAIGVDCSVQALFGDMGCDADAVRTAPDASPPFVSTLLAETLGRSATVRTDVNVIALDAAPTLPALDRVNRGRVVVFPLPQAQRVFMRPGRVDAVYVKPAPGQSVEHLRTRLAQVVGPQHAVTSTAEPLPGATAGGIVLPLLALIGLVTLSVGGLLVFNITRLSVAERRRELAVAAAVGVPPRLARAGLLCEAGAVGLVGGAAGTLVGTLVARPVVSAMSHELERSVGAVLQVSVSPPVVAAGVLGGVALATAAAWVPARGAARLDLASELHGRSVGRPASSPPSLALRAVFLAATALSLAAGAVVQADEGMSGWAPLAAGAAVLVGSAALFAAVAVWTPPLLAVAARAVSRRRRVGPLARLAAAAVADVPRQTGAMVTALAAAVALAVGLGDFLPATRSGVARDYGALASGRLFVTTLPVNNSAALDSKVSPATLDAIARVPGVERVDRSYFVAVHSAGERFNVSAYERLGTGFRSVTGEAVADVLASGRALVAPNLARSRGLRPGSVLSVPTPTGIRQVEVGGVWANPSDQGRTVTVAPEVLTSLFGVQPPMSAFVQPAPGVDAAVLADRIRAAGLDPGLHVYTSPAYVSRLADEVGDYLRPFWVLQRLLLATAFIATAASLLLAGVQRRREQGVLAAVGLGPRGLRRIVLFEAAFVGAGGAVLGVVAGVVLTALLTQVAGVLFGLRPPFEVDVVPAAVYSAAGLAVVVAAALWPARLLARTPIVEVLRYE